MCEIAAALIRTNFLTLSIVSIGINNQFKDSPAAFDQY